MLRVAIESVLGVQIENGDTLVIRPCVPDDWPRFRFRLEIPDTGGRMEVGGYVDGRAVVATQSSPRQRPGALADVWLDTKITDSVRGHIDLRGAIGGPFEGANLGTFNFSDAFQNYSPSLEARDAYVDVRLRNADRFP
jgi:hypothetical protein